MFRTAHQRRTAIEQRRQLHARIARARRRLDGHTSRLVQGRFLPNSWRRHVQDHPVAALAAAAGIGMLLAQLFSRTGAAGKTGDRLAQWLAGGTWATLLKHVEQFLGAGGPADAPPETEADDE